MLSSDMLEDITDPELMSFIDCNVRLLAIDANVRMFFSRSWVIVPPAKMVLIIFRWLGGWASRNFLCSWKLMPVRSL